MQKILKTAVLAAAFCVFGSALAADWPQFRGPNADGISPETGISKDWKDNPPGVLHKVTMGDGGYAGPAVADGRIFIIDHEGADDVVRAIDIETGENVWTFKYADAAQNNYGFARSTPTIDGDRIYTLSRLGVLHCLSTGGEKVWDVNITKRFGGKHPNWQMAMSPVIDGDKVIVVPGGPDAAVAALDKTTGKTIWKGGGSDKPGYATPVVATIGGTKQYVIFTAFKLMGVDAEDGKALWEFPWRTGHDVNASTPIVSGDEIFITSNYGRGCALVKIKDGKAEAVWENKAMASHFSTPVLSDGYIYGSTTAGHLACIEWETGEVAWKVPGFERGGVVAVDGALIAVDGASGEVVMFELASEESRELGRMKPLGGQSWTAPIVADGKLIVRNKAELAWIKLK